jgi:hypothetical protein
VCWGSRKAGNEVISDIIMGFFITDTIGFIILTAAQLNGMMNFLGWLNVVTWLFLTLGLGYLRFIKKAPKKIKYI